MSEVTGGTAKGRIKDIFVSDLTRVEILGSNARFVLHVKRHPSEGAAPINEEVASIVMPIDIIPSAIARTLFALGQAAIPIALEYSKRLN